MRIELTPSEIRQARLVGAERQQAAMASGRTGSWWLGRQAEWGVHIEGAAGELAAAKALGIYWPASVDTYKQDPDLPPDIEVRTRSKDHYDLIIRDDDPADRRYLLVVGEIPTFRIVGWLARHEVRTEWIQDRGGKGKPAFFVPQHVLHPIGTL